MRVGHSTVESTSESHAIHPNRPATRSAPRLNLQRYQGRFLLCIGWRRPVFGYAAPHKPRLDPRVGKQSKMSEVPCIGRISPLLTWQYRFSYYELIYFAP